MAVFSRSFLAQLQGIGIFIFLRNAFLFRSFADFEERVPASPFFFKEEWAFLFRSYFVPTVILVYDRIHFFRILPNPNPNPKIYRIQTESESESWLSNFSLCFRPCYQIRVLFRRVLFLWTQKTPKKYIERRFFRSFLGGMLGVRGSIPGLANFTFWIFFLLKCDLLCE